MTITAARLRVEIGADTKGAEDGLGKVQKGLHQLGSVGQVALGTVLGQAITGAGRALVGLGGEALTAYGSFERLGSSLQQLVAKELLHTGQASDMGEALSMAAEKAAGLQGWVQKLAIQSPFTAAGVSQAYRMAMAYGFNTQEAKRLTQAMIDYSAGSGASEETMQRVALALGQIQARGKLAGQEVLQLTEAGLNVDRILADAFGKTTGEIQTMREKGLIPANQAIEAIVTSLERDFGGAARRQSGTISGLVSSLEDLKEVGLREFFGGVFREFQPDVELMVETLQDPRTIEQLREMGTTFARTARTIVTEAGEVVNWFMEMDEGTRNLALGLGAIALVGPTVVQVMTGLYTVAVGLPAVLGTITTMWAAWNAGLSLTTVLQIGLAPMAVTLGAIALAGGAVVAMWSAWNTQIVKTNERGSGAVGGAMQEMLEDMRQSGADAPKLADEFIAAYGRMNEQIANAGVAGAFVDRIGLAQQSLAALSGEISKSGAGYSTYITQMERAAQGAGLFTQRTENGLRVYQRSAGRIIEMSDAIGVLTREQFGNIQAQQETQRATALAADAQRYAAQAAQDLGQAYQEQSNWAGEVKTKFDALKDAQLKLNEAQASFSQNYADKVVSKLEAAGIKGEDLARALGALDDKMGTNTLATYEANKALDEAIKNYGKTKNLEDFDKALEANKSAWEKLDERLQQAKSGFEEAQTAFNNFIARIQEANGMEVTIYVNSLMKGGSQTKSSKRWGGDVTDLDDTRAAGGPTLAGRPYLVGEEGPEMFMPRTSGTVVNARQTQQLIEALMTGGGRGAPAQVVFQRGSIVAASNMSTRDLAVAVINEIRRM